MCKICADMQRNALTSTEAKRALAEIRPTLDEEHVKEVEIEIAFKEVDEDTDLTGFFDEYSAMMGKDISSGVKLIPDAEDLDAEDGCND